MNVLARCKEFFWGKGGFFDMGDRYPIVDALHESTIPNLFVIGDVGGTPDIKAALNAGYDVAHTIAKRRRETPEHVDASVIVLGAGPAGINAANELRKLGVSCIVFERKRTLAAIRVFEDELPLFYPSTGDARVRGDLPFQETTARELLDDWLPRVAAMGLDIREQEEVKGLRKSGAFVVTTTKGQYIAPHVIVATGKLTFLNKLGVEEEYDPRIVFALSEEREYQGKHILIYGLTADAVDATLKLAGNNTVTILDHQLMSQKPDLWARPELSAAVKDKRVAVIDGAELHEIGPDEAVIMKREGEIHHLLRVRNDIVFPFAGLAKALVSHRDMPQEMLRTSGMKFENQWDWKRYTWLILALVGSGFFYYEKKSAYDPIGLGALAGWIALVAGGFSFLRGALNAIDELRFTAVKRRSIEQMAIGGVAAAAGWWIVSSDLLDVWPRSLGAWYPAIYSMLVIVFGVKAILRWRDSIQTKKTLALIFFQVFFFWILPEFILRNWLSYTLVYAWPLVLAPHTIRAYLDPSFDAGLFYFWWAIILSVVVLPVFVATSGKKYCSWVCGCGGLAETVGDTFRQYAPKGKKNIARERSLFYVTMIALVFTFVVGAMSLFDYDVSVGGASLRELLEKAYSWGIDWALVSFIPIALYPFFGGKIFCRYWCPTAFYMHVTSGWLTKRRLGYFKIESDEERCIACNMCSRYCEVGIDVMRFALKGTTLDNTNSSCIACGVCISVCPTDVLKFGETKSAQLVQITLPS